MLDIALSYERLAIRAETVAIGRTSGEAKAQAAEAQLAIGAGAGSVGHDRLPSLGVVSVPDRNRLNI
jgi:hypothetical protein